MVLFFLMDYRRQVPDNLVPPPREFYDTTRYSVVFETAQLYS